MTDNLSKDSKLYLLPISGKLVSSAAIFLIGDLTRLHAKQRIENDPKSYEGINSLEEVLLPDESITDKWTKDDWRNFDEKKENIENKYMDIYLSKGGWTHPEAHIYMDKLILK